MTGAALRSLLALATVLACGGAPDAPAWPKPRNVLLITIDDLRPALGAYGDALARTPHIDALARGGMVFERAYVQEALCHPSRTSLLTGLRPATTGVYDLQTDFRARLPDAVTLPQLFKQAGFATRAVGKVHHGHGSLDDAPSWSERPWHPRPGSYVTYGTAEGKRIQRLRRGSRGRRAAVRALPFEAPEVAEERLVDGRILEAALETLDEIAAQPFFLAVGFRKPHLPFVAPKKYWDLFPPDAISLAHLTDPPDDAPIYAATPSHELRNYHGVPREGPIDVALAVELIRGYYASVAYVDALVGRLIDGLKQRGQWENTVVVLWGDHGFHLGEHGVWGKATLFEESSRAPLIFRVPGMPAAGATSAAIVEFLDVYPTLAELFGLAPPAGLEGRSLVPLLQEPTRAEDSVAITQHTRPLPKLGKERMGTSLRTHRHRLTLWTLEDETTAVELYDYERDPAGRRNTAGDPAAAETIRGLRERLERALSR